MYCSDEDKLKWAFKLYDMDNNGVIDLKEMAAIIETLDCIEGVKPGHYRGYLLVTAHVISFSVIIKYNKFYFSLNG